MLASRCFPRTPGLEADGRTWQRPWALGETRGGSCFKFDVWLLSKRL